MDMKDLQITIQAYLDGELRGKELAAFELLLKTDPKIVREVQLFKDIATAMQYSDLLEKKAIVTSIQTKTPIKPDLDIEPEYIMPKSASNFKGRWWALGFAVFALIGFAVWQYQTIVAPKNQAIALAQHILKDNTPFENIISLSPNDASDLAQAMRLYDVKNYQEALPLLEKHQKRMISDNFSRLYLSICYLMTEQTDKAIEHLQTLIGSNDLELLSAAKWYLALAYLQKGQVEEAKPLLTALENHPQFGDLAKGALNKSGSN